MSGVRVRFAPSPTGFFHVGSARSALFNWFVARQDPNGVFILRIEDTDVERNREEWVDGIVTAMHWLGMNPDEGPFRQSDNAVAHVNAVEKLRVSNFLFYCDCTGDQVAARKGGDKTPGYDGYCRDRGLTLSSSTALRFRTPDDGVTVVHDEIRGDVEFANSTIDDFVVAKSSGAVLFALANVIDDRNDAITHVIRGEEHLPNTPKQILLWMALNEVEESSLAVPQYAHLPVLVNEQRKKLSKRRDPVAVELYRDQGYLPEAFVNYLALLGWSPRGDEEKVDITTCISQFHLTDVSHSPAFFDIKKLAHLNGLYIRSMSVEQFIERCAPWIRPASTNWRPSEFTPLWNSEQFNERTFAGVAPLVQERVAILSEVPAMVEFLFVETVTYDETAFTKTISSDEGARELLRRVAAALVEVEWKSDVLHAVIQHIGEELSLPLRKAQAPVRCAATGRLIGLPLFESLELLGREATLARLQAALVKAEQ